MEFRWKNNITKEIGIVGVTDEDAEILNAVGYVYCDEEEYEDEYIEVWKPSE